VTSLFLPPSLLIERGARLAPTGVAGERGLDWEGGMARRRGKAAEWRERDAEWSKRGTHPLSLPPTVGALGLGFWSHRLSESERR